MELKLAKINRNSIQLGKTNLVASPRENEQSHNEEELAVDSILDEGATANNEPNPQHSEEQVFKESDVNKNENNFNEEDNDNEDDNRDDDDDGDCEYVSASHFINLVSDDEESNDANPPMLLIRDQSESSTPQSAKSVVCLDDSGSESTATNDDEDNIVEVESAQNVQHPIINLDEDVEGDDYEEEEVDGDGEGDGEGEGEYEKSDAITKTNKEQAIKTCNETNSEIQPTKVIWSQAINEINARKLNENLKRNLNAQTKIAEIFGPDDDVGNTSPTASKSSKNSSPVPSNVNNDNHSEKSSYSDAFYSPKSCADNLSSDSASESGEITDDTEDNSDDKDNEGDNSPAKKLRTENY